MVGLTVAIDALLELHATLLLRFTVAPEDVVPIARNWLVSPAEATVCEPGITAIDTTVPPAVPPLDPLTVSVALEVSGPAYPVALAVIVVEPAPTAVATPAEFTVATEGVVELHVTDPVMFCVER